MQRPIGEACGAARPDPGKGKAMTHVLNQTLFIYFLATVISLLVAILIKGLNAALCRFGSSAALRGGAVSSGNPGKEAK